MVLVSFLGLFRQADEKSLTTAAEITGVAIGWFVLTWAAPWVSARRQFRGSPSARSPIALGISEAGLDIHSAHADSRVSWSAYVAWAERTSVFVILPQPRIFVPIPKRAFNEGQLAEFREILRRNVGKR
jgi:YcxB-like protein